jgi:intracellular sulfur oxidation DsrE/DsrF family protein
MFETLERRSPEVDHSRRSRRDAWRSICNSGYGVLQRKKALECLKLPNAEVLKWITVVDHEGMRGARSVTQGMEYFRGKKALECLKLSNAEVLKWITVVDHKGMRGARSITPSTEYIGGKKKRWSV